MGLWNLKAPNTGGADPVLLHVDTNGIVDGIDVYFNSSQEESDTQNISDFTNDVLKKVGCNSIADVGATFKIDRANDELIIQMRKQNSNNLFNWKHAIRLGRAIRYTFNQSLDQKFVAKTIEDSYIAYQVTGDVLVKNATTISGLGNPVLHFTPLVNDIGVTTPEIYETTAHIEIFRAYVRQIFGTSVQTNSNLVYTLVDNTDFNIEIVVSSEEMNELYARIALGTKDTISSWYHAILAGLLNLNS